MRLEIDLSDIPNAQTEDKPQAMDLSDIPDVTEETKPATIDLSDIPDARQPHGVTGDFGPSLGERAIDFVTGGHVTFDPHKLAPPPEVRAIDEQAKEVPSELEFEPPETAEMGFFEDPITWASMAALQAFKYGGTAGAKLLRGARELAAWATGGASEAPAIAKGGAKIAAKAAAAKPMEKTMAKAVLKEPLGREAVKLAEKEAVAGIPAATRLAPELVKPKPSPEWDKVHGMMAQEKTGVEWSGILGKTETKLFDRFAILRGKSRKAYENARTFSTYKDTAQIKFNELQEALKSVRGEEKLFTDYITAHRAQTRAARGLKNPNKVTLEDANEAIKAMEADYVSRGGNIKDLKDARDSFKKWTHDYILKEARDSGIISQASYADIVKNNKWYATFDVLERLPENLHDIPSLPSKEYFSVANQGIIKRMLGTEKKIVDPIEATIRKFTQAQATFARNKVANTLIDDSAMKPFLRPVAGSAKEYAIMKNQKLNPVMEGAWSKKEFGTINRFKDGKVEKYLAPIEIAESMKQLTPWQAPRVIQALNNIFRKSATSLYLPFTISNAMRDALMAYTTSPVYKTTSVGKFGKDWVKGFWEGAKHEFLGASDLAKTYIQSGGGFGYVGNLRQASLAKHGLFKKGIARTSADIVTSPFKLIEKISATIELAPRLGTFQRAKMLKISDADAALIARQSTIDFNRGGTYTKVVNQFVPFLNARVQGRVVLASALKRDPKGTAAKVFAAATIPGMAAYAWNRLYHSDLYDDIPEYVKQNYFCVITGSEKDKRTGKTVPKYLVISKGDVGQIAWNPIEFGLDKMWKKDQEGTGAFLVNYLSDLSPVEFARKGKISPSKTGGGLLPPIVKGFAEDWANLNLYTGYEIVPYYMGKTKPPELQYREWTPETYKKLGKLLKISPERIKNFAGNIVAGYGREGLNPESMLRGLTGRLMRSQGGEIENRAWIAIKDIEQGYIYTRAYIEEFIKAGDIQEVVPLVYKWNAGLKDQIKEFNDQFKQYGLKDKGSLLSSYLITEQKINSVLVAVERRKQPGTTLEKKLLLQPKKTKPTSIDLSDISDVH